MNQASPADGCRIFHQNILCRNRSFGWCRDVNEKRRHLDSRWLPPFWEINFLILTWDLFSIVVRSLFTNICYSNISYCLTVLEALLGKFISSQHEPTLELIPAVLLTRQNTWALWKREAQPVLGQLDKTKRNWATTVTCSATVRRLKRSLMARAVRIKTVLRSCMDHGSWIHPLRFPFSCLPSDSVEVSRVHARVIRDGG